MCSPAACNSVPRKKPSCYSGLSPNVPQRTFLPWPHHLLPFFLFSATPLTGSLFPDQRLNPPGPWQWKCSVLIIGPPGNFHHLSVFFFKYSRFTKLCQYGLYCKVTQSHTYIHSFFLYIHFFIHSFFNILFHHGLSQDIEYSSLCYTVGLGFPPSPFILCLSPCFLFPS